MSKKKELTKPILVRRSPAERKVIKELAVAAGLSEARLMVAATLMLSDFKTVEELHTILHLGGQLWQTRARAVMQVRRIGHQLERLQEETNPQGGGVSPSRLDEAVNEVAAVLRHLGAGWGGR